MTTTIISIVLIPIVYGFFKGIHLGFKVANDALFPPNKKKEKEKKPVYCHNCVHQDSYSDVCKVFNQRTKFLNQKFDCKHYKRDYFRLVY